MIAFIYFSATKSSILAAALFVLHKKTDLISAPASCVHLSIIIFFVYFKVRLTDNPLFNGHRLLLKQDRFKNCF